MKKPIILHCINSLGTGGAEVLLKNTIPLLKEFEHVICYLNKPDDLKKYFEPYPVYCLDHFLWSDSFKTINRIKKIIRQHEPAIIHSHLFNSTLLARLACPAKIKFAFTVHSPLSEDAFKANRLSLIAEKLTYRKKATLITVSKTVQKDYDNWIGIKGDSKVLYNYVEENFFHVQLSDNNTHYLKLVAVGNFQKVKNYFKLVEALALLRNKNITLDIFGDGNNRKELQKAIDLTGARVNLKGRVTDVSTVLGNYDAYIMPSIFEGFGIAPMEAMAAGLPLILSDLEVFREVAGDLPIYFNPHDANSIADAILSFTRQKKVMKEKALQGKQVIYAKSSKEKYIQTLRFIYNDMLNEKCIAQPQPISMNPLAAGA